MNKTTLLIIAVAAHVSLLEAAPKSRNAQLQKKEKATAAATQALAQNKIRTSCQTLKHTVANITLHKSFIRQGTKNVLLWEIYTVRPIDPHSQTELAGNTAQSVIVTRSVGNTPEYTALYHGIPAHVWAEGFYKDIQKYWQSKKKLNYAPLTPQQRTYLIQQESSNA